MEIETMIGNVDAGMKTRKYGRPTFQVVCTIDKPYTKSFVFKEKATAIGTAITRAVVKMRKELKDNKNKEVRVKATKLKN